MFYILSVAVVSLFFFLFFYCLLALKTSLRIVLSLKNLSTMTYWTFGVEGENAQQIDVCTIAVQE